MESQIQHGDGILNDQMPKAPRFTAPAFGDWLANCRGERSLEQIAIQVRAQIPSASLKISRTNVQKWEQGRVPNWLVLRAFSVVFEEDLQDIVLRLTRAIRIDDSTDLLRHTSDGASTLPPRKGVSDVPASDRVQERQRHAAFISKVQNAARQLAQIGVALGAEAKKAQRASTRRGVRDRKAG